MKEMSGQDRQNDGDALARRKRIAKSVGRVVGPLSGVFWTLVFITLLRTGYLSWIGITVGALFAGSAVASPILGWAGKRRLRWVTPGVHFGILALFLLSGVKAALWPRDDAWHPYRFDDELAAIEAKRAVPDAENAAHRYDALFARMDENDEPNFIFSGVVVRDELGTRPWRGEDYPQASQWLDSQAGLINELLEIGWMEKCRWPVQADTYDAYTVPYRKLNHSMKLLWAAGNRDLGEGRLDKALTEYFCILRIADHLHQQPSIVDSLTAFGHERFVLPMLRYVLVQSDLSAEKVAGIASRLPPAADSWPEEWERLSEFEKLRYMNLLGRLYEVDDKGTIRFAPVPAISPQDKQERGRGFPRLYWLMTMPRDPHRVRGMVDKYFAVFDPVVRSEYLPQTEEAEELSFGVPDAARAMCNFYRWFWETACFNERTYTEHRRLRDLGITARRGTWLVLGLRCYHDTHGAWPQTLDVIAEYVPAEAFVDPTAGGPFAYVLDGEGFKLYSKGDNRIDDGGRRGYVKALHKSEDDISMWPPPPPAEPPDKESLREELEAIYGKDWVEANVKDKGSDKR
jgi:hypothetical protein